MLAKYAGASSPSSTTTAAHQRGEAPAPDREAPLVVGPFAGKLPQLSAIVRARTSFFTEPGSAQWYRKSRSYRQVEELVESVFGAGMAKQTGTRSCRIGNA